MYDSADHSAQRLSWRSLATGGVFWLLVSTIAAGFFYKEGLVELLKAWQTPEYSHGPIIPILSAYLFLGHLKSIPVDPSPVRDRWVGVLLLAVSILLALTGKFIQIGDFVAYALILWVGAMLLINYGWARGRKFWAPVLHLVYMLPLPGALYYGVSTYLQGVSSELGVYFLRLISVPVYLEGNIIDLGVLKLHVAEACSGLRYLFPILSFSYVFAVLYRGPVWHKIVLLISAAPISVLMNSVRIAIAGYIANNFGLEHVEGFSHFFEGWVIFVACVALLFLMAWIMVLFRADKIGLAEALDLETTGIGAQLLRVRNITPSTALKATAGALAVLAITLSILPAREIAQVSREPFVLFPKEIGSWQVGERNVLTPDVERVLKADDYLSAPMLDRETGFEVDLLLTWYADQMDGGVHSPEVCLPGGGWEIAELRRETLSLPDQEAFTFNRAVIQQGTERMLVYYWFEQQGRRTASEFVAKLQLMVGKAVNGHNDSALVRLIVPLGEAISEARGDEILVKAAATVIDRLPRFVPAP